MKAFHFKRGEKGFTLIEVLLSVTLLAIVLMTFFSFFVQGGKMTAANADKLAAVHLAHKYLEEYVNLPGGTGEDLLSATCSPPPDSPADLIGCKALAPVEMNGHTYKIWLFVQDAGELPGYYPVIVRAYYGTHYVETFGYYHPQSGS